MSRNVGHIVSNEPRNSIFRRIAGLALILSGLATHWLTESPSNQTFADLPPNAPVEKARPAKVVTLTSPIDESAAGRVRNAAISLNAESARLNQRGLLVIELTPGTSFFGAVRDLSQFLTSSELSDVQTVAWVPESIDGNNALVALACQEIVMHPDAELGDLGRGQAVDPADLDFILRLASKGHNSKVNSALARALSDPSVPLYRAVTGDDQNAVPQILTGDELKRLQDQTENPIRTDTLKEAGVVGKFSGSVARRFDFLATSTAKTRNDLATIYQLPSSAFRVDPSANGKANVAYIKIDGVIEPVVEQFVQRQIDRSLDRGKNVLLFEVDSPGGLLSSSEKLAHYIAELDSKKVRTIAYIPREALSGAAMISLGCDEIYMAPDARIGDAAPIETRDGESFDRVPEKLLSAVRVTLRDLGEKKGRPPAICEAMADKDLKVYEATHRDTGRVWYLTEQEIHASAGEWIQGPLVPETREGNLLTINGHRAQELKLAEFPVADVDELKQRLGLPLDTKLNPVGRNWVDSLIFFLNLPIVGGALITFGILLIYLELHFMTGFMAILSVLCFALFFWSKYLGGTSGWLEVVLFVVGLGCIGIEVFVVPGFGVFGVSGSLLIIAALVMASQTFGNLSPETDFRQMTQTVGILSGAIVVTVVCAVIMSRFLPRMPLIGNMILAPPGSEIATEPQLHLPEETNLVGQTGLTTSPLRPSGKAEINGEYMNVTSAGGYIDSHTEIQVFRHEGNRIYVRPTNAEV